MLNSAVWCAAFQGALLQCRLLGGGNCDIKLGSKAKLSLSSFFSTEECEQG